jgi:hypothetical protein
MPETYYVRLNAVDVRPLEDAFLAIENDATDARAYFELVSLRVSPAAPTSAGPAGSTMANRSGSFGLYRVSAVTGGDTVTPVKMDTADATFPSQVTVVNDPNSVTTTALFRRINDCPTYGVQTSNSQFSSRTYGGSMAAHQKSHFADVWRGGENVNVEPIILRAGEGIALVQEEFGLPHSMIVSAVVTNTTTGATYVCRSPDVGTDRTIGGALYAIMNGSGSGVTLAVKLMFLPMDGESALTLGLRLMRMDGYSLRGDAATVISADTSKTAPSSLKVSVGPMQIRLPGEWQPDMYTTHGLAYQGSSALQQAWLNAQLNAGVFTRKTYTNIFPNVGISQAIGIQSSTMDDCLMLDAAPGSGIVVTPGQGLALVGGRFQELSQEPLRGAASTFHNYDIEATILYYPPPTGSGTFPPVGDVDFGVVYGPNGNDFTGTLVQPSQNNVRVSISYGAGGTEFTGNVVLPAASDVASGVGYGANGTEFTGSSSGSGGGGIWVRRR